MYKPLCVSDTKMLLIVRNSAKFALRACYGSHNWLQTALITHETPTWLWPRPPCGNHGHSWCGL